MWWSSQAPADRQKAVAATGVEKTVPNPSESGSVDLDPQYPLTPHTSAVHGHRVAVAALENIEVFDVREGRCVAAGKCGQAVHRLAWSGGGDRLWAEVGSDQLVRLSLGQDGTLSADVWVEGFAGSTLLPGGACRRDDGFYDLEAVPLPATRRGRHLQCPNGEAKDLGDDDLVLGAVGATPGTRPVRRKLNERWTPQVAWQVWPYREKVERANNGGACCHERLESRAGGSTGPDASHDRRLGGKRLRRGQVGVRGGAVVPGGQSCGQCVTVDYCGAAKPTADTCWIWRHWMPGCGRRDRRSHLSQQSSQQRGTRSGRGWAAAARSVEI